MKTKSILVGATLVGLLTFSWFAGWSQLQIASATEAANRERRANEEKIGAAVTRRAAALEQSAAVEKKMATLKKAAPPLVEPISKVQPTPRVPTISERLRTEPDAQVLWLKLQRSQITATYEPLFRNLGLDTEQISGFEDNVIQQREQQMDLNAIAAEQQKTAGVVSPETAERIRRVDLDYKAAQRALLGDAAFQRWQEYERTTTVRNWVNGWAGGATVFVGEPFTPQQGEELVQMIANASDSYRKGASVYGRVDWAAVEAAAQHVLTPQQFRLFTTMEPPLPTGGRFQNEFYQQALAASKEETKLVGKK